MTNLYPYVEAIRTFGRLYVSYPRREGEEDTSALPRPLQREMQGSGFQAAERGRGDVVKRAFRRDFLPIAFSGIRWESRRTLP